MSLSIKLHEDRWIVCVDDEEVFLGGYRQVEDWLDSADNCRQKNVSAKIAATPNAAGLRPCRDRVSVTTCAG
jgi:hypothetical protein